MAVEETSQTTVQPTVQPDPVVQPVTPAASSFDLFGFAQSRGYDVSAFDGKADALAGRLFDDLQQARAVAAWAQQNVRQQPAPEPEPEPKPSEEEWTEDGYFSKRWDVPAYDQQWESMVSSGALVKDQTGKWVPAPEYSWMAANPALSALNAWEQKRAAKLQGYLNGNLPRQLYDDLREPLDRRYATRDLVQQMIAEERENAWLAATEDRLAPVLYRDPRNVPSFDQDPAAFAANLTDYGKKFFQTVDDIMAMKPQASRADLLRSVLRYAPPSTPGQSTAVAPAAGSAPSPAQPASSAAGTAQASVPAQQPQGSFADDALNRSLNRPSGNGTPAATPAVDPRRVSSANLVDLIRAA